MGPPLLYCSDRWGAWACSEFRVSRIRVEEPKKCLHVLVCTLCIFPVHRQVGDCSRRSLGLVTVKIISICPRTGVAVSTWSMVVLMAKAHELM